MLIQGHLDEAVYTRLPAGCGDMGGEVVLLQRAVYGLRQAGGQSSLQLGRVLQQKPGMGQSKADSCVFKEKSKVVDGRLPSLYLFMLATQPQQQRAKRRLILSIHN